MLDSSHQSKPARVIVPGSAWGNNPAFTVPQAALALGIPAKTLYAYISARRLGHVRLGGRIFVRQSHIDQFINSNEIKPI